MCIYVTMHGIIGTDIHIYVYASHSIYTKDTNIQMDTNFDSHKHEDPHFQHHQHKDLTFCSDEYIKHET